MQVPLVMADQNAHHTVCDHLKLTQAQPLNVTEWKTHLADRWDNLTEVLLRRLRHPAAWPAPCACLPLEGRMEGRPWWRGGGQGDGPRCLPRQVLHIAMVGKYTGLSDAYLSVIKSLQHACLACRWARPTLPPEGHLPDEHTTARPAACSVCRHHTGRVGSGSQPARLPQRRGSDGAFSHSVVAVLVLCGVRLCGWGGRAQPEAGDRVGGRLSPGTGGRDGGGGQLRCRLGQAAQRPGRDRAWCAHPPPPFPPTAPPLTQVASSE